MQKISQYRENKFEWLIYLSIISIFIANIKIYIPVFAGTIMYFVYVIKKEKLKLKIKKWNKSLTIFMLIGILSTGVSIITNGMKIDLTLLIKLILNLSYLLAIGVFVETKNIEFNKQRLVMVIEIIIILNFIQVIYLYLSRGLLDEFLSGTLTKSSDSAYILNGTNVIGEINKNIWASKLAIVYVFYVYVASNKIYNIKKIRKISVLLAGGIAILLILSRTAQLAIIIPIVYLVFKGINQLKPKIKIPIFIGSTIIVIIIGFIFFTKFFHISFDMTDGGYTRLVIWMNTGNELIKTNFVIGNGIGYSSYFIQNVIGRSESNVHNVFLNILFEFGVIGIVVYFKFLYELLKENIKYFKVDKLVMIILPIFIICNLQYLGYDNDLVIGFVLIMIINKIESNKNLCSKKGEEKI